MGNQSRTHLEHDKKGKVVGKVVVPHVELVIFDSHISLAFAFMG